MKSFDILANPDKQARKNTFLGGVLSIVLTLVVIFIMSREYSKFKGVSISKNLYLDPKPIEEQLRVKLNIILRHAPCAILSLDILDDLRHH